MISLSLSLLQYVLAGSPGGGGSDPVDPGTVPQRMCHLSGATERPVLPLSHRSPGRRVWFCHSEGSVCVRSCRQPPPRAPVPT